ncbi:hypothetical protein E1218_08485 [Kribbella turkmenica]|uniref:Uncharacterized protein n=1 Tax=Kribbella turkmenica TaxID=2530375 RepID=A0A4V2YGR3_9ACTN|nr:hypothetical protein E1218_08485 [Kribbella turkmenica]
MASVRWTPVHQAWWRLAYRRVVLSSFRTVPLYREKWALAGRTEPVLVLGRYGESDGAIHVTEATRRLADLVPLAGGTEHPDPQRGACNVLAMDGGGAREVLHDPALGDLGTRRDCGAWHLDWPRVYARETKAGPAFTLLRQSSPRFVDILIDEPVGKRVVQCRSHGTPAVTR